MNNFKLTIAVFAMVFVAGCASTRVTVQKDYNYTQSEKFSYEIIDKAQVTEQGMSIFKTQLNRNLEVLGLIDYDSNKVIEVTFTNYYMRHGAARVLAGVMAGADNITSNVLIKDKDTGNVIAKLQVVSKNPTATGSARGLIEQHANKITAYIRTKSS